MVGVEDVPPQDPMWNVSSMLFVGIPGVPALLPGQIGLGHKIFPGFVFCEQELQVFPAHTLLEIVNGILNKGLAL